MADAVSTEKNKNAVPTQEEELIDKAYTLFEEFRDAYESEWQRLEENEDLYLGKHWDDMGTGNSDDPEPMTPVLQSTVENLKADLMDNFPEAIINPETPNDRTVADIIGAVIKQNHDCMGYMKEYRNVAHDLLTGGYGVQEVGYDPHMNHGLGGAFIRYVNNHNIMFDPQVVNLQDGRAVFKFSPRTIEWLEKRYPDKTGQFSVDTYTVEEDDKLNYDSSKNVILIEYWWKEFDTDNGYWKVHMALLAGHQLLEDSRTEKPDGYFSLGEYPFICTPMFRRKNSCLGYGVPDFFGTMQRYSDKLDQIILKNAAMSSHNKLLVTDMSGFDADDLRDWSKEVHQGESLNGITWFATPPLPQYIINSPSAIRQSIKEESGANDFSRGNTSSGVTAASAIAALQEMSSKRSRMIAMQLHEAYKEAVRYEIEFEREYNLLPREVILTQNGGQVSATFESAIMERETALGNKVPIEFMISIKVQRENRWAVTSHNELMIQMTQMGIITPQQAAELMIYEGKEEMLSKMYNQQQNQAPSPEEQQLMATEQQANELDAQLAQLQGGGEQAQASPEQVLNAMQQQAAEAELNNQLGQREVANQY